MDKLKALALQTTKEIVVKFVETGRISPGNFAEHFGPIYHEVLRTLDRAERDDTAEKAAPDGQGRRPGKAAKADQDRDGDA